MADAGKQISSLVSTLAARFAQRTLGELPAMRGACIGLSQGNEDSRQQLKRWAHKVRGTGASIGLADVSARAGDIEDLLASGGTASLADQLTAKLAGLEAELARGLEAGPQP